MRKLFMLFSVFLTVLALLSLPQGAAAQLAAGVQLSYGWTNFSSILSNDEGAESSGVLNGVWAHYDHDDLRFTGAYQGTFGFGNDAIRRHLGQIAASYRVLEEGPMQVFAGLGYHFITTNFKGSLGNQPKDFSLSGHGFAGQVNVDIELTPQLRASAVLTASPWVKWSFNLDKDATIDTRSSFNAKLDLTYQLSDQLSVQVGLLGGGYRVPKFTSSSGDETLGTTKGSFSALSVGVTQRF